MYPVFTIEDGKVSAGAQAVAFELTSAGKSIPAITVGESGRGRELGVLPVEGVDAGGTILAARVGETRSGKPKLIAGTVETTAESAIVVLRTGIGFRGSNGHDGDFTGWVCADGSTGGPRGSAPAEAEYKFSPRPGRELCRGRIADGLAGRAGGGEQLVLFVPKGEIFSAYRTGRLYGAPARHYYVFDGEQVLAATWKEREASDLF